MTHLSPLRAHNRRSLADLLVQIDSNLLRAQNGEEILRALRPALLRFQCSGTRLYLLHSDASTQPVWASLIAALNSLGEPVPLDQLSVPKFRLAEFPLLAHIIEQQQPYFIEDILTHPQVSEPMRAFARDMNYAAVIVLPLLVNKRWLGFLVLNWQQARTFNNAMRSFFRTLQANLAYILAGCRSTLEREEAYREVELLYRIGSLINAAQTYAEVVQAVGQYASLGSDSISIAYFQHYDLQQATYAEISAVWGARPERIGMRIYDGTPLPFATCYQPQIVTDTSDPNQLDSTARHFLRAHGCAAYLSMPLTFGETVLGTLNFLSQTPRDYSHAEQRLAKGVAELVAVAVDRIRLREASLRAQQRTQRIAQINAALLMASDETDILNAFIEYAAELAADFIVLAYVEPAHSAQIAQVVAAHYIQGQDVPKIPVGTRFQFDEAFKERAQQLLLVEDVRQDKQLDARERALSLQNNALALALLFLRSSDGLIGVLSFNWGRPRAFSADERAVFEAVLPSLAAVVSRRQLWLAQAQTLEKLRQMDRLKDEFLSSMSHELRTPLNAVIGLSDVILQGMDGDLTPRLQQDIQTIYDAGQQLLSIVNDVLDIAKIEAGSLTLRRRIIDLRQPLHEALRTAQIMAASKRLLLGAYLPDQPLWVEVDANRIRQVALNLLSNAIKFTDSGNVRLYAYAQERQAIFCVQDEGIGIAPEHHALIFEQFRQVEGSLSRRKGGTGLGLAISKRLVELHGGRIWLESALGKGAAFYVSLPSL